MECDFVYGKRLDSINIRIIDIYVMHAYACWNMDWKLKYHEYTYRYHFFPR